MVEPSYGELLSAVKQEVVSARTRAARAVNSELILLHWRIGRLILDQQRDRGWGSGVVERLSRDLRAEFPGVRGFSDRNLRYMRALAAAYPGSILQEGLAELPWSHVTVLLDRVDDPSVRRWYAHQDVQHGWSAAILTHQISSRRHERVGSAPNNFPAVMPPAESDQAREILQDPYALDFLNLEAVHSERDLEQALVSRLTRFLSELGSGFAYVGRQYKITVGRSDYYLDLLFYHLRLRRYIVFELKAVAAEPEHLGKLNFYVNAVDEQLRDTDHGDRPTLGILLAADRDDVAIRVAFKGLSTPLAVSTYKALPDDVRPALPTAEALAEIVRDAQHEVIDRTES